MIEAADRRIRVPQDLSVTGVDGIDQAEHLVPPLTTVRVPAIQTGEEIARYIIR